MSTDTAERSHWTPPRWLNTLMIWMLRTPGLQRFVGRGTALITFTGARSGREYTTPISYRRDRETVTFTTNRTRRWWRNLATQPVVGLRLAGKDRLGTARVLEIDEALPRFIELMKAQKVIARVNGVEFDDEGHPDPDQAASALETTVMIAVELDSQAR